MAWTVHEDEYRTEGYDNLEEILQYVVHTEESVQQSKPTVKYTKSSQVFATPSPLTAAELSSPIKHQLTNTVPWQPQSHTPTNSSFHSLGIPYTSAQSPQQRRCNNRFNGSYSGQCDRKPKIMSSSETCILSPGARKRGMGTGQMDHMMATELNEMPMPELITQEVLASKDMMVGGGYSDWSGSGSKYFQSGALTADSLRGRVYETAKDQHGCRYLQRWLDTNCDPEALQVMMNEIIPHVGELMTDQYANFLIQKLFDIMPDDVRYKVAIVAAPQICMISLTPHGTFSVQKMIETISTREEMEIISEALCKDVVRLVKDAHGNHVIQKVLQRFDFDDKEYIYRAVATDCVSIAKNKQGCCVLQRCLEHASPRQKAALVDQVLACCLQIVQDPFGNYVLQYVLEEHDSKINDTIALAFLPHLVQLSMNKFSSNVMEKVLRGASGPVQVMYMEEMCNPEIISHLIQDDYGNYVLQTALTINAPVQAAQLVNVIRPFMPLIRNAPYAKKMEGKMENVARKVECNHFHAPRDCEVDARQGSSGGSPHGKFDRSPNHGRHYVGGTDQQQPYNHPT
ncbi:putative pumillio protein 3 [Leishmania major strain Friedlin]|uniref:Putative pumillio protein 3 n=1 Tax=Leishmania major TaxID=5664 RepID=Q4QC15_LEIMA|nr:putative pumillio protein 3 [Leishmania major strain Friedlin]CAG9573635.1 pumillio_protein_3_-_putative [Leishmania major strain Friedlin]CAJ05068.1 putative pumillio protein 3 [Leishmania major strain Friedlin]|eukprot:XP_001683133.1 putative pumillio protein 3 [Leishmania major strain Friedlin]